MFPDYSSEEFKEMALIKMALNVSRLSLLKGNLKLGWGSDGKEPVSKVRLQTWQGACVGGALEWEQVGNVKLAAEARALPSYPAGLVVPT